MDDMAALEAACADVRAAIEAAPIPDQLRARSPRPTRPSATETRRGRRPLVGHSGGHRVGVVRRHERDVPEHQRARRGHRRRASLLGVSVRRAHRLLPREARTRPGRHGHRRGRPAPDSIHSRGSHVHDRSLHRSRRPVGHRGLLRARRGGRVRTGVAGSLGGRQEDVPRPRARDTPQGARDRALTGRSGHRHATCRRGRGRCADTLGRRGAHARGARQPNRGALRLAAGHRVGFRRRTARVHPPVPARHRRPARAHGGRCRRASSLLRGLGAAPGTRDRARARAWRSSPTRPRSSAARSS